MRKTKFVALLLVVAIVASMVVPSVSAAGDYTLSIVDKATGAATINANAGDTVDVYVTISNNPGVSCVAFNVSVPEGWSIKAAQNQKLFMGDADDQASSDNYTPGPNKDYFLWLMATGTQGNDFEEIAGGKLLTQNGNLVLVRYQIPEDAQTGAYTISVTPDLTNCFYNNVDGNGYIIPGGGKTNQAPATESLTINVQGTEPEAPAGAACSKHTDVTEWTDWAGEAITESGHYKLTAATQLAATIEIAEGIEACIDLNGYELSAPTKARTFKNAGTLSIMDSSEGKTGIVRGTKLAANGANIYNTGTFTLYSGTVTGGDATGTTTSTSYGGNFWNDGNLNLLGGFVTDGNAVDTDADDSGRGGNIYSADGTLVVENCVISGGSSEIGGNAYLASTNVTIKGDAQILDGTATATYAGNFYLSASPATIQDNAIISGGTATTGGGNIYATGASSKLVIKGNAVIKDGEAGTAGGNIYCNSSSSLDISGNAQIKDGEAGAAEGVAKNWGGGNIYVFTGVTANISGNVQIIGGTSSVRANSIVSRSSAVLTISGNVVITAQDGTLPAINNYSSTIKIQTGVTTYSNPAAFMADCVAYNTTKDAEGVTCYKTYATLADALAASAEGDTVTLVKDATATVVSLKPGVTMDLNGKILTADEFTSALAQTLDSVGGGKIVAESVSFDTANKQLPVTIGNETTFENIAFATKSETVDNKHTYKCYVKSEAAATLIDDAILAGAEIAIEVKVSWTNAESETKEKTFYLGEADLAKLAQNWDTKMVVLTINDVSGVTDLTCTAQIRSGTVVVTA